MAQLWHGCGTAVVRSGDPEKYIKPLGDHYLTDGKPLIDKKNSDKKKQKKVEKSQKSRQKLKKQKNNNNEKNKKKLTKKRDTIRYDSMQARYEMIRDTIRYHTPENGNDTYRSYRIVTYRVALIRTP